MDKRQLIQEIQKYNPSATDDFLQLFKESELQAYLVRLTEVPLKKIRLSYPEFESDAVRIAS